MVCPETELVRFLIVYLSDMSHLQVPPKSLIASDFDTTRWVS